MRNRSFRDAKYSLRFRLFWTSSAPETKRASRGPVLGEPQITGRSVIASEARKSRSGSRSIHRMATGLEAAARKKLRKRAAKAHEIIGARKIVRGQALRDRLACRPLPPALVGRRRGTAGPAFKADSDRIEVGEL